MKKLRFLIAIILIFSLLPIFGVSATEETDEVKVIETYEFNKLEAFGLINESDSIFYYDTVMRSTFMSYIMKVYPGYSEIAPIPGIENPFSDVDSEIEEINAISAAAYAGLISGEKGSEFRPYDNITKSEAAKVFVSMLGYTELAKQKGGYPVGYLTVADKLGIFNGCEFTEEGYFTILDFLKAFGNVLDTDVLQVRSVTVNSSGEAILQTYERLEGKSLLYYVFGIHKDRGIIQTNEFNSIKGTSNLVPGQVEISGRVYKEGTTNARNLLGYSAYYYYRQQKGAPFGELVYVEPYNNNVINTHSNQIEKSGVSKANFRYYKNAKDNKYYDLKLSKSATLIHNGDLEVLAKEKLCPVNGTVTLIDNNDDKVYDVIFVMDYLTIMASTVSTSTYQITDAFGGVTIKLDPEAEEYGVLLEVEQPVSDNRVYRTDLGVYGPYVAPVKHEFAEIKTGNIILYAESKKNDRNIKYVKVANATVKGTVKSIYKDRVVINDEEYELSPSAKHTVSLGEYGLFYLDIFGKIVAKSLENDTTYGFLNGINKDSSGFDSFVRVQIFTENGNWVILELANNVKTNITSEGPAVFKTLKPTAVFDALNAMPNFRQLVTYTVNKEGKINNITIAQSFEAYSDGEKAAIGQDVFRKIYQSSWGNSSTSDKISSATYASTFKSFSHDILIDDSTRLFVIPSENGGNQDDFYMESIVQINNNIENCIPYDLSEGRIAGAIVMFGRTHEVSGGSPIMLVEELITTMNSKGDLVTGVTGIYSGEPITLVAANDSVFTKQYSKGDIIQFITDVNGEICEVKSRCDANSLTLSLLRTYDSTNKGACVTEISFTGLGKVHYIDTAKKRVVATGKDNQKVLLGVPTSAKIYVFDKAKGTLTEGTFADLENGTVFFVKGSYQNASELIIYR